MAVKSYVVVSEAGRRDAVARSLEEIPGCTVCPADNADVLLLLTDVADSDDAALDAQLAEVPGVHSLTLAFGELDPRLRSIR